MLYYLSTSLLNNTAIPHVQQQVHSEMHEENEEFSAVLLVSAQEVGAFTFAERTGQLTAFGEQHSESSIHQAADSYTFITYLLHMMNTQPYTAKGTAEQHTAGVRGDELPANKGISMTGDLGIGVTQEVAGGLQKGLQ